MRSLNKRRKTVSTHMAKCLSFLVIELGITTSLPFNLQFEVVNAWNEKKKRLIRPHMGYLKGD